MFINACKFHREVLLALSCRPGSGFLKEFPHPTWLDSATVMKW